MDSIGLLIANQVKRELNDFIRYDNKIFNDKIVCLGDSVTQGDLVNVRRYTTWLSWITGTNVINSGINGNTLAQMLARINTDVISHKPGICTVFGGTNDVNSGRSLSDMTADVKTIAATLLSERIIPIFVSVLPRSDNPSLNSAIYRFNEWLNMFCIREGFTYVDIFSEFSNTDGSPIDGYLLADKLHPTLTGMRVIATTLAKYIPVNKRYAPVLLKGDNGTTAPNPLFTGIGNAEVATSWNKYGNAGSLLSYKLEPYSGNDQAKWQVVKKKAGSANQTGGFSCVLPKTLNAGKKYKVEIDIDFIATSESVATSYFQFKDASNATIGGAVFVLRSPTLKSISMTRVTAEIDVPANTANSEWITFGQSITDFTLKIGKPRIVEIY